MGRREGVTMIFHTHGKYESFPSFPTSITAMFRLGKPASVLCRRRSTIRVIIRNTKKNDIPANSHGAVLLLPLVRQFQSTTARPIFQAILDMMTTPGKSSETIGLVQMKELIDKLETQGREKTRTVVLDVRSDAEVSATGPLSASAVHLPLPDLQEGALELSAEDFAQKFGFAKPHLTEETLVFSCQSGMRAGVAAKVASAAGYTKVLVYSGSAKEWFAQ